MTAQKASSHLPGVIAMTDAPEIDLRVDDDAWLGERQENALLALAQRALRAAANHTRSGKVDILLTGDSQMQELNRDWRKKDKPTDVLSFPSDDDAFADGFLGDIALGFGVVTSDMQTLKRTFDAHVSHLLVHGYLHLLGFDHETEEEAGEMEPLETKILADLGHSDPYCLNIEK